MHACILHVFSVRLTRAWSPGNIYKIDFLSLFDGFQSQLNSGNRIDKGIQNGTKKKITHPKVYQREK